MDKTPREIVCTKGEDGLKVGKVYHLVGFITFPESQRGEIVISEDPHRSHKSELFSEINGYVSPGLPETRISRLSLLQNYLHNSGKKPKLLSRDFCIPYQIQCDDVCVELGKYHQEIRCLGYGDVFVIGRAGSNFPLNIALKSEYVSRIHAYIIKTEDGYEIYDVSLNGTKIPMDMITRLGSIPW